MEYFKVIPLINLPLRALQEYTYSSPGGLAGIKPGFAVEIPFRSKTATGIVSGIERFDDAGPAGIKPIGKTLFPFPLFTEVQLKLAEKIAAYYFQPLSSVMKMMAPTFPKTIKDRGPREPVAERKKTAGDPAFSERLIIGPRDLIEEEYLCVIRDNIAKGRQTMLIAPEIPMVWKFGDILENRFPETKIASLHGLAAEGRYFQDWTACLSGEAGIILGTRQAVFAPAKDLGAIIIDSEYSMSHKQWDMNPRYDARAAARWRAELEDCPLLIGGTSVRTKTLHRLGFEPAPDPGGRIRAKIIDLRQEIAAGNRSIISEELRSAISKTLEQGKQALLIVNRRGHSSFIMCRDCGFSPACPDCSGTLREYAKGLLGCALCGRKEKAPVQCPKCGSHRLKSFGLGIDQALEAVNQEFPRARTDVIHQDIARKKSALRKAYQSFDTGKTDILIGSPMALSWRPFNLGLAAFMNIDSIANSSEWLGNERTFTLVSEARAGEPAVSVLIQTYLPENKALNVSAKGDFAGFYHNEIETRQELSYPPFSKMIKLFFRSSGEQEGSSECLRAKQALASASLPGLNVIGPVKPHNQKVRGKYISALILKIKPETFSDTAFQAYFKNYASNLPPGWIIDVDPEILL